MADTNEIIRTHTITGGVVEFVIRGGKIYIVRRAAKQVSVYHYSGDFIKDHFSASNLASIDVVGGRFSLPDVATPSSGARYYHYSGEHIRTIDVDCDPRFIRIKAGRYWIPKVTMTEGDVRHYNGEFIRTFDTGDVEANVVIKGGRLYIVQGNAGYMRFAGISGEELERRGWDAGTNAMRFYGGRVYATDYYANEFRIASYGYINKL